jgi:peptidoglycan/xylan/chitin deacetylase (PgdA/CDA1 family)
MTEARCERPDGKRSAFLFSIDIDVESPLSWRLGGEAASALGELEQRRFGMRQGLPRLLGLLREHGVRASCFVPTADAERHQGALVALVDAGHEVGLHGHHRERVDALDAATNTVILDHSLAVFEAQAGVAPRVYRSPAWELTPELHALLRERGLVYDSSLMGYDHPYTLGGLTEIPVEWLTDDAVHLRFRAPWREKWPPSAP